ncbi:N-6 DNA methylase [Citricoccus muralis]|uniref:site-specific DNA-methyltransferase (adenine-specific) n=1 Tax=Citricoccus muralis TaxID=169134 RepID=A0ABY8H581_9MICC|nr:N-6 DNA methylase [Citricoccus muralis]WFP16171.1 N-6 DNA methylase [Citricoccus muralis]
MLGDISVDAPIKGDLRGKTEAQHTTSISLARALSVGCLARLDSVTSSVNIWDPAAGSGFAGSVLVNALRSAGVQTHYRGQVLDQAAVADGQRRFHGYQDAEIAYGDTLVYDAFPEHEADLVIVDAPWGMDWKSSAPGVEARRESGSYGFGLPQHSDSIWLFISLALEKLRPSAEGGGRVAALVTPGALSSSGATGDVRRKILEAALLESVTRLPDGLASSTGIPLYLVTFTNRPKDSWRGKAMIADLQTEFTTERQHRSMPVGSFRELESGLRTGNPGPRNRSVAVRQFTRRNTRLERLTREGKRLSWNVTTYADTPIDNRFLESRYGPDSGVSVVGNTQETIDLDPSRIFEDDSRELLKDIEAKGWKTRRLSGLIAAEPAPMKAPGRAELNGQLYIPMTREGRAAAEASGTGSSGRVLSIRLDDETVDPSFLMAWLNSEQGVSGRRRAIEASSTGSFPRALRPDSRSLMRWADELIVPVPDRGTQLALASADERLASFEAELSTQRESIWASPESAEAVVSRIAGAFDDSLGAWLDQLPYPIASALWTAETGSSPGEQQRAYIHAWEAIVTFHATVLLSASRTDLRHSGEVEAAIGQALREQHLGIERASFGTWVIIIERVSKEFRRALEKGDADEIARVHRSFADLGQGGIERLVSKDLVKKVNEVNNKRNRWLGHTGYTSDEEWNAQVVSLVSDLSELRQILGNVWAQLLLVRAGSSKLRRDGRVQTAEVAVGTRSPFKTREFSIGDEMIDGDLYLAKDGSQSPLPLGQFVQLRSAPQDAQYTTYFYNRTEGASVRMISYQYGPQSEILDDTEGFRSAFGGLSLG